MGDGTSGFRKAAKTDLASELSRRDFMARAGGLGLGAVIASALPIARRLALPAAAVAATPLLDPTMQAFYDTVIPGRRVHVTQSGQAIDPKAIAGVDPEPGAVEADALQLGNDTRLGFELLAPTVFAELQTRSLTHGADFLDLGYGEREAVLIEAFDYGNPTRLLWEAGAAVAFTAFCAAATVVDATDKTAVGYRVMGHPGAAPHGYADFSYRRRLNRGRTRHGYLP
jgi:hypothetical protein